MPLKMRSNDFGTKRSRQDFHASSQSTTDRESATPRLRLPTKINHHQSSSHIGNMASDEEGPSTVQDGEQLSSSMQDTNESDISKKRSSSERESNDEPEDEPTTKKQRTGSIESLPTPPTQTSTFTPTVETVAKEIVEEAMQEAEAEKGPIDLPEPQPEQQLAQEPEPVFQSEQRVELVMEEPVYPEVDTTPSFDDDYAIQIRRSIALALQHVGFDGATKEAMESFAAEVDSCTISRPPHTEPTLTKS